MQAIPSIHLLGGKKIQSGGHWGKLCIEVFVPGVLPFVGRPHVGAAKIWGRVSRGGGWRQALLFGPVLLSERQFLTEHCEKSASKTPILESCTQMLSRSQHRNGVRSKFQCGSTFFIADVLLRDVSLHWNSLKLLILSQFFSRMNWGGPRLWTIASGRWESLGIRGLPFYGRCPFIGVTPGPHYVPTVDQSSMTGQATPRSDADVPPERSDLHSVKGVPT